MAARKRTPLERTKLGRHVLALHWTDPWGLDVSATMETLTILHDDAHDPRLFVKPKHDADYRGTTEVEA